jgi:DNA-binding transcriptional regulator GbsR (MarR family)
MQLTPVMERYVLHWGEMGARWGVNRSVAQIHALLYLSPNPITAEEISETLALARSNVSTSLKELQSWGLVRLTHVFGDRRDHFLALSDAWEILLVITEQRKHREIDPTLAMLRECVDAERAGPPTDPRVMVRIENMLHFMEALNTWYEQVKYLPNATLTALLKMGAKVARFVGKSRVR